MSKRKREDSGSDSSSEEDEEWTERTERKKSPRKKAKKAENKTEKKRKFRLGRMAARVIKKTGDGIPRFRVTKKIKASEFKWMDEDIEVGSMWFQVPDMYSCCSRDGSGVMASKISNLKRHLKHKWVGGCELPKSHISVEVSIPGSIFHFDQ